MTKFLKLMRALIIIWRVIYGVTAIVFPLLCAIGSTEGYAKTVYFLWDTLGFLLVWTLFYLIILLPLLWIRIYWKVKHSLLDIEFYHRKSFCYLICEVVLMIGLYYGMHLQHILS